MVPPHRPSRPPVSGEPALCSSLLAHLFGNSRAGGQVYYTCNLGELIPPVEAELPAALLE